MKILIHTLKIRNHKIRFFQEFFLISKISPKLYIFIGTLHHNISFIFFYLIRTAHIPIHENV